MKNRKRRPERFAKPTPQPAAPLTVPFSPRARKVFDRAVPFLLVLVVLLGLGLRAVDLKADPPPDLSWSTAHYSDEGMNNYSARNMALYGTWKTDDFLPFVIYPLTNILVALAFKLFGLGFLQVRLVSVLAGVAGVLVMYLLVRREAGRLAGLIAGLALAACYPLVMYSRLGMVETVQILFLLLTGLFYSRGLERPREMALSGLFAAATVLFVKVSAVFIAPVMVALFAWQFFAARRAPNPAPGFGRGLGFWFAGVGAAALAWFFVVFLPYRADYFEYVLRHSLEAPAGHPVSLVNYLVNTFSTGATSGVGSDPLVFFLDSGTFRAWFRLIPKLPVIALVGYLALPRLASRPGLRYILLWFVAGVLMLGWMNYRPPRYEIVFVPALVVAFAVAVGRVVSDGIIKPASRPRLWRAGLWALWLWPLVFQLTLYSGVLADEVAVGFDLPVLLITLAASVLVAGIGYLVARFLRREVRLRPLWPRIGVAAVLLGVLLWSDIGRWLTWYRTREHALVEYSEHLDWILPEGAVLAGSWAPTLLMQSRRKALCITDWANNDDPLGRFRVTHLISREDAYEQKLFDRLYPETMLQSPVLQSYLVRGFILTVHELPQSAGRQ
ncbi:glycosyltransferase family 39 protein [candidate division WOR-3 bacterium]|nr:glycosyltransferase family 39 protein [candidate division WOR-3 bacterium]